jgi:hypothetical protein
MRKRKSILSGFLILFIAAGVINGNGCSSIKRLTFTKQEKLIFDSFRKQVNESVADPVRAEELIEVGEDLALELHDYIEELTKMAQKCIKANADFDATPEQLESCYKALNDYRREKRETVLSAYSQTRSLTTPAEWQALSSRKNTLRDLMEKYPGLF